MRGNIKSFEKPFTHAEVVALAERTLKRFDGDRNKAGRYARSMEDRYESAKWAQVVEVIVTGGRQHATVKKTAAQLDREIAEALARPAALAAPAPAYDDTPFTESPAQKAKWLRGAKRRFPEGSIVRIVQSDEPAYVDVYGTVSGYDLGPSGSWPLVQVQFERPISGSKRDGFYGDGNKEDEIVRVAPNEIAAILNADDDENVALDLVMQDRNGSAAETLRRLVPDEDRRNFIKRVGTHMKTLRAR